MWHKSKDLNRILSYNGSTTDWQRIDLIFLGTSEADTSQLDWEVGERENQIPDQVDQVVVDFSSPLVTIVLLCNRCWYGILGHTSSGSVTVCKYMLFPVHYLIQVQTYLHASKDRYCIFKLITSLTYLKWQGY